MSSADPIVCRPTAWFRYRAGLIFLMFGIFAVMFYIDGSTGYREENKIYILYKTFHKARDTYATMSHQSELSAQEWKAHASAQHIELPDDPSLLPAAFKAPLPWPETLHQIETVKQLQKGDGPWQDFTEQAELDSKPPKKLHTAYKLREQWFFFTLCSALAAVSLFFLVRTSRRRMVATHEALIAQNGRSIPYGDFKRLDLRKWDNKGIAYAEYDGSSGTGRVRIDGLTYGGFKKESGSPAEKLMDRLRAHFTGEILEYTSVDDLPENSA